MDIDLETSAKYGVCFGAELISGLVYAADVVQFYKLQQQQYSVSHNFSGKQANHQNFVPSLVLYKL